MEFKGLKVDFQSLALLITAITTAIMTIKGVRIRDKKKREKDGSGDNEGID